MLWHIGHQGFVVMSESKFKSFYLAKMFNHNRLLDIYAFIKHWFGFSFVFRYTKQLFKLHIVDLQISTLLWVDENEVHLDSWSWMLKDRINFTTLQIV